MREDIEDQTKSCGQNQNLANKQFKAYPFEEPQQWSQGGEYQSQKTMVTIKKSSTNSKPISSNRDHTQTIKSP